MLERWSGLGCVRQIACSNLVSFKRDILLYEMFTMVLDFMLADMCTSQLQNVESVFRHVKPRDDARTKAKKFR